MACPSPELCDLPCWPRGNCFLHRSHSSFNIFKILPRRPLRAWHIKQYRPFLRLGLVPHFEHFPLRNFGDCPLSMSNCSPWNTLQYSFHLEAPYPFGVRPKPLFVRDSNVLHISKLIYRPASYFRLNLPAKENILAENYGNGVSHFCTRYSKSPSCTRCRSTLNPPLRGFRKSRILAETPASLPPTLRAISASECQCPSSIRAFTRSNCLVSRFASSSCE